MVVDTSALVAVLENEPIAARLSGALDAAEAVRISVVTMVEAGIVVEARRGELAGHELDLLLNRLQADIVSVTTDHAALARDAYRRFGKGRHRAGLNFGDCFAYALAVAVGEGLLFVGNDFANTDVLAAQY
jgi:ribonuclease VapC